jgi:hypothetical protein
MCHGVKFTYLAQIIIISRLLLIADWSISPTAPVWTTAATRMQQDPPADWQLLDSTMPFVCAHPHIMLRGSALAEQPSSPRHRA